MRSRRYIPVSNSALRTKENIDYQGYNSQTANDALADNVLRYATDTRISTLGRQTTRQGCDFYSVPAGETLDQSQTSTTGAADQSVGVVTWKAAKYTAGADGRLTKAEVRLKNTSGTGPVIVKIYSDNSGSPGTLLATSSIASASITGSYTYVAARFIEAPEQVSATSYWIVCHIQDNGTNSYEWSSTTSATTSKASSDSGVTWSSTSYSLNIKTYVSTDGGVLGQFRAVKSDGTVATLMAYKESAGTTAVATVDSVTGALTNIKTGLSSSATRYEFAQANDVVYYVNGYDAPRKWDFTTEAAMGGSPSVASQIALHVNSLFFVDASDPTRVFFSDAGDYETFTSTNFLYVPSPKTADWITRMLPTNNRNMLFITRKTKYILSGSDISIMTLNGTNGSKGCIAPDSVFQDRSGVYFASDSGAYRWNGTTDELLTESIENDYYSAANRDAMSGIVFNNRYYLFYTPAGGSVNSECWVINTKYGIIESNDLYTYIGKCDAWLNSVDDNRMIQGSSVVGALYYAERSTNNYSNLGRPLTWEIRTKYEHYNAPSEEKEVPEWRPRFSAGTGDYDVTCAYAVELSDETTDESVSLDGGGYILGGPELLGTFEIGGSDYIHPEIVIGESPVYIQYRYKREGVDTPVEFLGHTTNYFVIPY